VFTNLILGFCLSSLLRVVKWECVLNARDVRKRRVLEYTHNTILPQKFASASQRTQSAAHQQCMRELLMSLLAYSRARPPRKWWWEPVALSPSREASVWIIIMYARACKTWTPSLHSERQQQKWRRHTRGCARTKFNRSNESHRYF
jgi:hypothetical protein